MAEERISTHWQGCWKVHHACAVILLERILASPDWEADCIELGCTDADHAGRAELPRERPEPPAAGAPAMVSSTPTSGPPGKHEDLAPTVPEEHP